jgi:PKD repeat protein/endonuclease/exonuclease/phosphatase family metal-dependent hydrolase
MQKLFASLVVWLAGVSYPLGINAQEVRVMQWNVERGLGRLSNNTNAQAEAIARVVNYNQPDILLFNEVDCSNGLSAAQNEAALIDWVTNNVAYLGAQAGVTFYVKASSSSDGFIRNAVVSRYPIFVEGTYTSANMIRGLHAFRVQLQGTNVLQVFHAHFECCNASSDCTHRQANAQFASSTIRAWAATNSLPYIFAGDWNEDESNPQCTLTATYAPITMVRTNGNLVEFKPGDLDANSKTISTPFPTRRFDYCLAGTNRLSAVSGFVFNSVNWVVFGLYTNASPQNLADDSTTSSDHCCVLVDYSFPVDFYVLPTNILAITGIQGGPFNPSSQMYTLTNTGTVSANWRAAKSAGWLTISETNGTLAAGAGTNVTVSINATANSLIPSNYTDSVNFSNTISGTSYSRGVDLTVQWPAPVASFAGAPTNGVEPLTVTFADTSTGNITSRFWDYGDANTTNVTTNSVSHIYAAGLYTVDLIVNGPGGSSTNSQMNYIYVLTAFQAWQIQYFGSTNNPAAESGADPDGDGQNNAAEFSSGTNPTNSASAFRITSILSQGTSALITWATSGGKTNVVQGGVGDLDNNNPSFSNQFFDMSDPIVIPGNGDVVTNFFDDGSFWGDFSTWPTHYYRIRLAP